MRLKNRVAIVTGAGRGIGRATAVRLAEEGAAVVVAEIDEASAHETAGLITARGQQAVAIATECRLVLDENLLEDIKDFFRRRGMEMGDNNPRQAYIPENARPIPNPVGTAPGFIAKHQNSYVITLPGVPRELTYLMEHTVLPFIQREYGLETVIKSRLLRTAGVGESAIDRQIADLEVSSNPTVGLAAHPGAVDVRIAARAKDADQAQQLLDEMEDRIRRRLGDTIYGIDKETIEAVVVELASTHRFQLAVVETNTGGHLTDRLTGANRLVSCAARLTEPGGTLYLTHIEDGQAFERYMDIISKLPDIDSLEEASDFTPFMAKGVPEVLRRRALRKLWRLNPVFANLDGLNDYDEDFTDAATLVEGVKTIYKVGKGMLSDEDRAAAPASASWKGSGC